MYNDDVRDCIVIYVYIEELKMSITFTELHEGLDKILIPSFLSLQPINFVIATLSFRSSFFSNPAIFFFVYGEVL